MFGSGRCSLAAGLAVGLLLFALLIPAALTGWNGNLGHLADLVLKGCH